MKGLDHFSISQLQTYLNCPASYYYQYIDKLDWEFQPADMLFGAVCHRTISRFHKTQCSLDKMTTDYERRWNDAVTSTENLRFRSLDKNQLMARGKRLIELYYEKFDAFRLPFANPESTSSKKSVTIRKETCPIFNSK